MENTIKSCHKMGYHIVCRSKIVLNLFISFCFFRLFKCFQPSTYVFPGGVIETKADFSNEWMELFKQSFAKFGKDFTSLVNIQGPRPPLLKKSITDIPSEVAFRICAIRETFEESGILLLKRLTDEQQSHLNVDEIQNWRKQIYADATKFLTMCR